MASLTEAAYFTRRAMKYGAIAVISYIILRILFAIAASWWRALNPPPPPPATVMFGKLPPIDFPDQEKPVIKFRLETVGGTTGEFGPSATVFPVLPERGSLLALERATNLARGIEFMSEPVRVSGTVYRFTKEKPLPSTLQYDILSDQFIFNANWRTQPELLAEASALSEVEAIAEARGWLAARGVLTEDLESGPTTITYLKVAGTELVPALSQSEAQFVRVDLFRSDVVVEKPQAAEEAQGQKTEKQESEHFRVLPLRPNEGIVSVIILKRARTRTDIVHVNFTYIPVDYDTSATYPLMSSQEAWRRLREGKGYWASFPESTNEVAIRSVSLAYLDPPGAGGFLHPIYVFEGDAGFVGYIGAIADEQIQSSQ